MTIATQTYINTIHLLYGFLHNIKDEHETQSLYMNIMSMYTTTLTIQNCWDMVALCKYRFKKSNRHRQQINRCVLFTRQSKGQLYPPPRSSWPLSCNHEIDCIMPSKHCLNVTDIPLLPHSCMLSGDALSAVKKLLLVPNNN